MRADMHWPSITGGAKCGKHSVEFANTPADITCEQCRKRLPPGMLQKKEKRKVLHFPLVPFKLGDVDRD